MLFWHSVMSSLMRHSKLIALAHVMSHFPFFVFHPGMSLHACHWFPVMMVIPMPELMSENASTSMSVTGVGLGQLGLGWRRMVISHLRSSARFLGAEIGWKGFAVKSPSMAFSSVRTARPLGTIEQVWSSFPYNFLTSLRVWVLDICHSWIVTKYFSFFTEVRETHIVVRSHRKPM